MFDGLQLLGPARRVPLVKDFGSFDFFLDDAGAGSTGEIGDGERGKGEVTVWERLAGDTGCGAVN